MVLNKIMYNGNRRGKNNKLWVLWEITIIIFGIFTYVHFTKNTKTVRKKTKQKKQNLDGGKKAANQPTKNKKIPNLQMVVYGWVAARGTRNVDTDSHVYGVSDLD